MGVAAGSIDVDNTVGGTQLAAANPTREDVGLAVGVRNLDADNSVFVGPEGVTISGATRGEELLPNDPFSIDLLTGEKLYGITASATVAVQVITNATRTR